MGKSLEQIAWEYSQTPEGIKADLYAYRSLLKPEFRRHFTRPKFDANTWRLIGRDGWVLQWSVREYPWIEEGYYNQQSSGGVVTVLQNVKADELFLWTLSLRDMYLMNEEMRQRGRNDALNGKPYDIRRGLYYWQGYAEIIGERGANDFGDEYSYYTDSQQINAAIVAAGNDLLWFAGFERGDVSGVMVKVGNAEYDEIWVTDTSRPHTLEYARFTPVPCHLIGYYQRG